MFDKNEISDLNLRHKPKTIFFTLIRSYTY